ncbi:MAG: hypothetical protein Q8L41_16275 [Anaerolineales bacterium]|nr:hypothetical protein [Anaerolineales bacterium]
MKIENTYPDKPNNIGKQGQARHPDGRVERYTIVGEICMPQTGSKTKLIYLQKIQFDGDKSELRLCYYIIGKLPKMKGKWVFGQYATFLPANDFKAITDEARNRGWI